MRGGGGGGGGGGRSDTYSNFAVMVLKCSTDGVLHNSNVPVVPAICHQGEERIFQLVCVAPGHINIVSDVVVKKV